MFPIYQAKFFIYLFEAFAVCSIGVYQHFQEKTCARASFFINSLQLQAISTKKGAPALAFSRQLKFLTTNFLTLN